MDYFDYPERAKVDTSGFPEDMILDFEDLFFRLRVDVARVWPFPVDWDLFFQVLFREGLTDLDNWFTESPLRRSHQKLRDCALNMACAEWGVFEQICDANQMSELDRIIYRAGLEVKERLMSWSAYHMGVFPYSFRTMISDGCLFFSKNESIYDPRTPDFRF